MPKPSELRDGFKKAFKNSQDGLMTGVIEAQGKKNTSPIISGLGCIGQAITIATGTFLVAKGALMSPSPENAVIPCATGLGMIFFSLVVPAFRKLFRKQ